MFDPDEYLHEYYDMLGPENTFLLDFYHEFYSTIPAFRCLLEIGGGPAIYPLISASSKASRIIFTDYHGPCRDAVKKWFADGPESYNWDPYFEYVCSKERLSCPTLTPDVLKRRLISKIDCIECCDVLSSKPLVRNEPVEYNIVSSNFCAESITDNQSMFMKAIRNIISLVRPGAHLVLSMLKSARSYRVGSHRFPAYPVDESFMERLLSQEGLTPRIVSIEADKGRDYAGIMVITARRKDDGNF